MKHVTLSIDRDFRKGPIDRRLYSSFAEHMGRCVYGGIYDPESPLSDAEGFRTDLLEEIRPLEIPLVRYPGGNFVSGYRWEDGVGDPASRPVRRDLAWKSLETNQMGLNEFMRWCQKANTRPMLAVNLGTRGPDAARSLLEYCNVESGTYWSDLRRSHGVLKPHGVHTWCLGNEMDGPWQIGAQSAASYGKLARETAKLMKWLDPTIELVACGSSNNQIASYPQWDLEVLDACYDQVDYLSVHRYLGGKGQTALDYLAGCDTMDEQIETLTAVCDVIKAKKRSKKTMMLSFDEWNVSPSIRLPNENEEKPWIVGPRISEGFYTVQDMLAFSGMLLSLINHSDRVRIACLAQLVNMMGPFMTTPEGVWKQTVYYPYLHALRYGSGVLLHSASQGRPLDSPKYGPVSAVVHAAVENAPDTLTIFAVNRDVKHPIQLDCALHGYADFALSSHLEIGNTDLSAHNCAEAPLAVVPSSQPVEAGRTAVLHPATWNVLRFQRQKGRRKAQ